MQWDAAVLYLWLRRPVRGTRQCTLETTSKLKACFPLRAPWTIKYTSSLSGADLVRCSSGRNWHPWLGSTVCAWLLSPRPGCLCSQTLAINSVCPLNQCILVPFKQHSYFMWFDCLKIEWLDALFYVKWKCTWIMLNIILQCMGNIGILLFNLYEAF